MEKIKQAVIVAGGKGIRLGKIVKRIPKPILKFNHHPFLHYLIYNLIINNIDNIIVLAGHKGKSIKNSLRKFKNVKVLIEKKPLGTGGALTSNLNILEDKFLFLNGDSFLNEILENKILKFNSSKKNHLILVKNKNYKTNKKLNGLSIGARNEILIKKKGNLMYSGVSYLIKKDLKDFPKNKYLSFEEKIVPKLINQKKCKGELSKEFFIDIGTKKNYRFAQLNLRKNLKRKCFFFDRDNTLIFDRGYTYKRKDLKWKIGAFKAIKVLNELNYLTVVITNQSGVARGYFTEKDVINFHNHMNSQLKKRKIIINDFYYCPYHILGKGKYKKKSLDRKPNNGMIKKAIKKWNIDSKQSFFIGDTYADEMSARKSNIKFYKTDKNLYSLVKNILKYESR